MAETTATATTAEQQQQQNEARAKAISRYRVLAFLQFCLGGGLLACGGLGTQYSDSEGSFGPPYYLGGFLVGGAMLIGTMLSASVASKGSEIDRSGMKRQEVACAITGQTIIGMFSFVFCFIGVTFAAISSCSTTFFDEDDYCSPEKEKIRFAIIGGSALAILTNIFSIYLVCVFGPYFGVVMQHRRRMTVMVVDQGYATNTMVNTMMPGTTFGAQGNVSNDKRTQQLQRENELLQQQLKLQQQLNQQQQQQYGGQFAPTPPANYGFSASPTVPPSASFPNPAVPPPPYEGLKQ